jgi:hypothetical protein
MGTHYLGRQTSARLKFVHKTVLEMKANFSALTLYKPAVSVCITYLNVKKLCILHTECIRGFHIVLRIIGNCFPKQH